jgi:hypothetical protein
VLEWIRCVHFLPGVLVLLFQVLLRVGAVQETALVCPRRGAFHVAKQKLNTHKSAMVCARPQRTCVCVRA